VEAERLLAIGFVGNDGFGAAILQPVAQLGAVISPVSEQLPGGLAAADQPFGGRTIMRLAAGQQDGKKTAFSISDCVDFRIAPAA
jgi:hypothetical protein